jgi:hypothetical protein
MVMAIMVIIISPTTKGVSPRLTTCSRGDHPGDGRQGLAPGSGFERRADYSVFYGQ